MKKGKVAQRTRFGIKGEAQKTSTTLNFSTVKTLWYLHKTLKLHKNTQK